ncbi:MAG: zf-HC2 domain-containing protein, partial [Candidatus Cybelea sp.]
MRCSSCEPRLDAYLEGALPRRQARAIAGHLHACKSCNALLHELRVVDALLSTTRPPKVAADFTASVVSATDVRPPKAPRRVPIVAALLLYVGVAWTLAAIAAIRWHELAGLATALLAAGQRD